MTMETTTFMRTKGTMFDQVKGIRHLAAWGTLAVLAACGSAQADGTEDAVASNEFVRVINVEVEPIETETFVEEIRLTSVAMASQDVMIEAEEIGRAHV